MHILLYCIHVYIGQKLKGKYRTTEEKLTAQIKYYTKQAYSRQISARSINNHTEIMIFGFRYTRREIIIKLS